MSEDQINPFAHAHAQALQQQQQQQQLQRQQHQYQQHQQTPSNLSIMTNSIPQSMMDWSFTSDLTTPTNTTMSQAPATPMDSSWQSMQSSQMYTLSTPQADFSGLDDEWKSWVPSRTMSA